MDLPTDINALAEILYGSLSSILESGDPIPPALHDTLINSGDMMFKLYQDTGDTVQLSQAIHFYSTLVKLLNEEDPRVPKALLKQGEALFHKYMRWGKPDDVEAAINAYAYAMRRTPPGDPDFPAILHGLGSCLSTRFEFTGVEDDIREAIDDQQQAVDLTPENDPDLPAYLVNLGGSLSRRFHKLKDPGDIYRAVQAQRRAIQLMPPDSMALPSVLTNLGASLTHEFSITDEIEFINEAISVRRDAVSLANEQDPKLPQFLCNLADSLSHRFDTTQDVDDIDEAVNSQRNGISRISNDHANFPHMLSNLGNYLHKRFNAHRDLADLESAINSHLQSLDMISETLPAHIGGLADLAGCYSDRFDILKDQMVLEQSIEMQRIVVSRTPLHSPSYPARISCLGIFLIKRHNATKELSDLDEAICLQRQAISMVSTDSKQYPQHFGNLGMALATRYSTCKDTLSLNESIEIHQEAIRSLSSNSADLVPILTKLGGSLTMKYMDTGDIKYLEEAVITQQEALDRTSSTDPELPLKFAMLGHTFILKFKALSNIQDINDAICFHQRAVDECKGNNAGEQPRFIRSLGLSYLERYSISNDMNDIHDAVGTLQRAVNMSPDNALDNPEVLNDLGKALFERFIITADIRDIDEAIEVQRKAVSAASKSEDFEKLSIGLYQLGGALQFRYDITRDLKDIHESVQTHQEAIRLVPVGDHLSGILVSFGDTLASLFLGTRDIKHLDAAVSVQREAIAMVSANNESLRVMFGNLGVSLVRRFRALGQRNDLEESLKCREQALSLTPSTDPQYHVRLVGVADSLMCLYDATNEEHSLRRAHELMKQVALLPGGSPSVKLKAARFWATLSENVNFGPDEIVNAYDVAFELLPLTIWLGQTITSRHKTLEVVGEFVNTAAAKAVSLGKTDKALEWLEQGRSVVWSQIGALRSPVDRLMMVDAELAKRFVHVSKMLEEAGSSRGEGFSGEGFTNSAGVNFGEDATGRHHLLAQLWVNLGDEIRRIPGFETFLKPLNYENIKACVPLRGALVVLNPYEEGCDAIILRKTDEQTVQSDDVVVVPLPGLSYRKANQLKLDLEMWKGRNPRENSINRSESERSGRLANGLKEPSSMEIILQELWKLIAAPVLKALQLEPTHTPIDRLWWCPTGPLSFLPLHAAGLYEPNMPHGSILSDYVISSYTPTLGILGQAYASSKSTFKGMVAISQASTPGLPPIPNTEKEVVNIREAFSAFGRVGVIALEGEYAKVDKISQTMFTHNWVHFACHATQHLTEPLQSAFHVHDGSLTLSHIMQLNIPDADFAFLSACQTSTGHDKLPDEAVHLAAGMMNAGYKSVVASMWSISDDCAPEIAGELYRALIDGEDGSELDSSNAAWALHRSVGKIKDQKRDDGDLSKWDWVPFIHIGL